MDIDRGFVKALMREGMAQGQAHNIEPGMLEASGREAYDFVDVYWRTHGRVPTFQTVEDQTGITFHEREVPSEPLEFWAKEIRNRHLYTAMKLAVEGVVDKLEAADPNGALTLYRDAFFKLEGLFKNSSGVEGIFDDVDDIMAEYEEAKLGVTGIPTPYPALNEVTQGWQSEDFIVIAGRPGSGKTFFSIIFSLHAWQNGIKTMLISTEMSRRAIRRRHASLLTKVSYGKLRRGKLTTAEEERFKAAIAKIKDDPNLLMMGKNMRVTLEQVRAQIIIHKPKLVVIDGFYLMRSIFATSKMKSERIAELLDATKEMGKELGVAIMITSQMNRGSDKAKGRPDLDRLAFSDNMGMIADYVFLLDRTPKMAKDKEMRITPVKIREGDFFGSIISTWDFDKCEFHQRRIEDGLSEDGISTPTDDDAPAGSASIPDGRFPNDDDQDQGPW